MALINQDEIQKAQKKVEKLNAKFIKKSAEKKAQRHVKEENEPVLDDIIQNFQESYAKQVVGKSMTDIVNFLKDSDV